LNTKEPDGPDRIWLEPDCCSDPSVGRTWALHNEWEDCEEGVPATEYVRVDLMTNEDAIAASAGPSLCDDCPPVNYPTDKTRCGPCPRRKGETACLSAVATNEPCLPDSTLKRCTICGFIVDTQYAAELPPRNAAASAQSETKEPSAKPAAAGDLERARALLADDPDEMDEEWLAGIITAIRAEARAEGATDGFQTTPRKTISG
jgi:hypothetical protein